MREIEIAIAMMAMASKSTKAAESNHVVSSLRRVQVLHQISGLSPPLPRRYRGMPAG